MSGEFARCLLIFKSAYLYRPTSAGLDWRRRLQDLNPDLVCTLLNHFDLRSRSLREINDSPSDKWAAIGYSYNDGISVRNVSHTHDCAQRQGSMGCRHSVHVIDFAI